MRADIVALARGWLGTPYHHQASLKGVGCDCLGLIRGVYAEACGQPAETPPPYSRDWAEASVRETMIEAAGRHLMPVDPGAAEPGDVLVFRLRPGAMAKHCGIITELAGSGAMLADRERIPGAMLADRDQINVAQSGQTAGLMARAPAKIIHAIEGASVCEVHITPWWRRRIAAAFRLPGRPASAGLFGPLAGPG